MPTPKPDNPLLAIALASTVSHPTSESLAIELSAHLSTEDAVALAKRLTGGEFMDDDGMVRRQVLTEAVFTYLGNLHINKLGPDDNSNSSQHSHGCLMLRLQDIVDTDNPNILRGLQDFATAIPESAINTAAGGIEADPHITAYWGFNDPSLDDTACDHIASAMPQVSGTLGGLGVFAANSESPYDVLYVEVESSDLQALHAHTAKLPNVTASQFAYTPHLTIAYLNPGEGANYTGDTRFSGTKIVAKTLTLSNADGTIRPIKMKGAAAMAEEEAKVTGDTSLPFADRDTEWDKSAADKRVRAHVGANDAPNDEYARAFLVCVGDPKKFGSYKLPMADAIKGKVMIVPRAIFNMAARFNQTDLPKSIESQAQSAIAQIYKRMAKQFKDPSLKSPLTASEGDAEGSTTGEGFSDPNEEVHFMGTSVAEFDLPAYSYIDGDSVIYPNSFLFTTGNYPDKNFSMSDEEMAAAVRRYEPGQAQVDYQHVEGPFDGELGCVRDIRKEGANLFGTVEIPLIVNRLLDKKPDNKKVSCTWDRADKDLIGLALVVNPRIERAALMAAFDAVKSERANRVHMGSGGSAAMAKRTVKYEDNPMQKHHDMACAMGAECPGKPAFSVEAKAQIKKNADFLTPDELGNLQNVHDQMANNGADCAAYATRMATGMPPAHAYAAYAAEVRVVDPEVETFSKEKETMQAEFTEQIKERDTKIAEMGKTIGEMGITLNGMHAEMQAEKRAAEITGATAFLDGLVKEFRLTPAERDAWVEKLTKDDNGLTIFAGSKDLLAARPRMNHAPEPKTTDRYAPNQAFSASGEYAGKSLHELTLEIAETEKKTYVEAFAIARKKHPEAERAEAAKMLGV